MKVYLCEKCLRRYESPIEVKGISCARSEDGIDHKPAFMRDVSEEEE